MRVLILSKEADGASIAYKLSKEGHHVDFWVENKEYKNNLLGFVNRPASWRPLVASADLVVCDMVGFSQYASMFQRLGKPTLCCNAVLDALELNRHNGMEAFNRLGINTPVTFTFSSVSEAKKLNWTNDAGYVIKVSGNLDVGKTYLCETEELYQWALSTIPPNSDLIIQELIPKDDSVEISTEGWFNGVDWIYPFNHTFEEKQYLSGNIGKMTGCSGNVVLPVEGSNKLIEETIMKFKPLLTKAGYRGPLDINCIVTKDKLYALELTCRFGYDAIDALITGLNEPLGALLFDTATGIKKSMDIRTEFLIAVRVTRDPYPYCTPADVDEPDKGMPICGLNDTDMKFTYLCDVYKDGDTLRYAASDGVILKATAFGRSVKEAQHRAYKICNNIKAIDIAYRNDIGDRVERDLKLLRDWSWL